MTQPRRSTRNAACSDADVDADDLRSLASRSGRGVPLTAYAPLAQGRAAADSTLRRIGAKHGVSAAQATLARLLDQDGVIFFPKVQRVDSQRANLAALAVRLDDED